MQPDDCRSLLALIDRLYEAVLDPSAWDDFLVAAAAMFGADHAFVSQIDQQQGALDYIGLPLPMRDAFPVSRYAGLLADDPRRGIFDGRLGQATHCTMGLSRPRLCGSRTYREYLKPLGIEYTMVAVLPVRERVTHTLGLTRKPGRTSFVSDDCALMNELVPHLERALQISRAVTEAKALRDRPARPAPRSETWDRTRLQSTFTLSPAQARLASLLFQGQRLKQAAARLGITEGSARQYLKVIFAKTGAKRQADLVRVIGETLRPHDEGGRPGAFALGANTREPMSEP